MQTLVSTRIASVPAAGKQPADAARVDAVLTASRSLVAVATRSLGAAAEEVPDSQWPSPGPADEAVAAKPRRPARSAASAKESR